MPSEEPATPSTIEGDGVASGSGGRIGPNAIIQMADALRGLEGAEATRDVFARAGLEDYLDSLPTEMVDECDVSVLHGVVASVLGEERSHAVSRVAGLQTGDYLLANRIPKAAQWVLRHLPAAPASRVLTAAVRRNAWTFAGSGRFEARVGNPMRISITGCPICRDLSGREARCTYYAATFERLFSELVDRGAVVRETACEATGAEACKFEVSWGPHSATPGAA